MSKHGIAAVFFLVAVPVLAGWVAFHLELQGSYPEADAVLGEAPAEIRLHFSAVPDMERTSFSVRGPTGAVELGDVGVGEQPEIVRAAVTGAMPPGRYTVSWVGAPIGDHAVRGRFGFTVQEAGSPSR